MEERALYGAALEYGPRFGRVAVDDYGNLLATANLDALRRELCAPLLERIAELEAALAATEAERARLALLVGEDDGDL